MIFAGILDGDQTKQSKIDLISGNVSLLVHLETTRGPQNLLRDQQNEVCAALPSRALGHFLVGSCS